MKRLMTTAAAVMALSTTAYAQDMGSEFVEYVVEPEQELFASDLIGSRIYSTETDVTGPVESSMTSEWNDLGEINDMVLDEDGSVQVVILGIGGFLGIGERDVAVSMDGLEVVRDSNDMTNYFLVVNADQEELENAPEFVRNPDMAQGGQSMDNSADSAGDTMENAAESTGNAVEDAGDSASDATGN